MAFRKFLAIFFVGLGVVFFSMVGGALGVVLLLAFLVLGVVFFTMDGVRRWPSSLEDRLQYVLANAPPRSQLFEATCQCIELREYVYSKRGMFESDEALLEVYSAVKDKADECAEDLCKYAKDNMRDNRWSKFVDSQVKQMAQVDTLLSDLVEEKLRIEDDATSMDISRINDIIKSLKEV